MFPKPTHIDVEPVDKRKHDAVEKLTVLTHRYARKSAHLWLCLGVFLCLCPRLYVATFLAVCGRVAKCVSLISCFRMFRVVAVVSGRGCVCHTVESYASLDFLFVVALMI